MQLWVLTGDKQETAINIGFACALLDNRMKIMVVNGDDEIAVRSQMETFLAQVKNDRLTDPTADFALVITGAALNHALDAALKMLLLELGCSCKSVICCRVSPLQKVGVLSVHPAAALPGLTWGCSRLSPWVRRPW